MSKVFAIIVLLTAIGTPVFVWAQQRPSLPPPPSPSVINDRNTWWYWDGNNWFGPYGNPEEAFRVGDRIKDGQSSIITERLYPQTEGRPSSKQKPMTVLMFANAATTERERKINELIEGGYPIKLIFINTKDCELKTDARKQEYYDCLIGDKTEKFPLNSAYGVLIKNLKRERETNSWIYIDANRDGNYARKEIFNKGPDQLQKFFEDLGLRAGAATKKGVEKPASPKPPIRSPSTMKKPPVSEDRPRQTIVPPWTPPPTPSNIDVERLRKKVNEMMTVKPTIADIKEIRGELERHKEQFLISLKKINQAYDARRKELNVLSDVKAILTVKQEQVDQSQQNIKKLEKEKEDRLRPHYMEFLDLLWHLRIVRELQNDYEK